MTIQARLSEGDPRLYNVGRDVAHNFGDVCTETSRRLEDGAWPAASRVCAALPDPQAELGRACQAFLTFVATAVDVREERQPQEALLRSGWFSVAEEAQVTFLAVLGTVMLGYFFTGVRDATLGGEGPLAGYADLQHAGRRTAAILALPPWRRRLAVWKYRARLRLLRWLGAEPVTMVPLTQHLDYDSRLRQVQQRAAAHRKARQAAAPPAAKAGP